MTRFEKLQKKWGNFFRITGRHSVWMCLDIGSHSTKVMSSIQSHALFPTCLVRDRQTHEVVAVGESARKMIGKLPATLELIYPVRGGKVTDISGCSQFLEYIFKKELPQSVAHFFTPPRVLLTHPFTHLEVQRSTWLQLVRKKTPRNKIIPLEDVLWKTLSTNRVFTHEGCAIDVGAMTTKYYLYIDDKLAHSFILDIGGDDWTRMIIDQLRHHYHLEVGWETAECLKKKAIHLGTPAQKHTVQGKNLLSNVPETRVIDDQVFSKSAKDLVNRLVEGFEQLAQQSSPEMMSKLIEKGVYITGGGCQLSGLRHEMEEKLKIPISISVTPQGDAVKGLRYWI